MDEGATDPTKAPVEGTAEGTVEDTAGEHPRAVVTRTANRVRRHRATSA